MFFFIDIFLILYFLLNINFLNAYFFNVYFNSFFTKFTLPIFTKTVAKSARLVVAGAVSGLFGVAADVPPPDSWRRDRQEHTDSDPVPGGKLDFPKVI